MTRLAAANRPATVNVAHTHGGRSYRWDSGALTNGVDYEYCVRSYKTQSDEIDDLTHPPGSSDAVSATADSVGPAAITGLTLSVE